MTMKPLLKLKNHETREFHSDRLHNSKVESEVWPIYTVAMWIISNLSPVSRVRIFSEHFTVQIMVQIQTCS